MDTKELVSINISHSIQMISEHAIILKNESNKNIIHIKSNIIYKNLSKKNVENDRKN